MNIVYIIGMDTEICEGGLLLLVLIHLIRKRERRESI